MLHLYGALVVTLFIIIFFIIDWGLMILFNTIVKLAVLLCKFFGAIFTQKSYEKSLFRLKPISTLCKMSCVL